jgi:hypothetical protein
VHIAAAYLDDLRKEDGIVNKLAYEVDFQKTRYKERLSRYHNHKYEKAWSGLPIPEKKKKLPKLDTN